MYRIHVMFRDQEKGKEKVLSFKAVYFFSLYNSPSPVVLVGYLMHSGICKNMSTTPLTPDGIYCVCLNLLSLFLKSYPRMSVHNRIRLFIKQKQRRMFCLNGP